jgi:ABC-2 type transport system permease protein
MSSKLAKITRMEFRLTAVNKAFIIITILGPFLIAAVTVLPTLFATSGGLGGPALKISLVNADPAFAAAVKPALAGAGMKLEDAPQNTAQLDQLVLSGALDGYLVLPDDLAGATRLEYVSRNPGEFRIMGVLQAVIGQSVVTARLVKAGLTTGEAATLAVPPQIENRRLTRTGEKEKQDFLTILLSGIALTMLLYMTILLYGQTIGRSVLMEKTSKTVEIMLSSVRPMDLLFGKILGKAVAGLLQYAIWIGIGLLFLKLLGPVVGMKPGLGVSPAVLAWLVVFFVIAFFIYCSLFAGLGAASTDEQHLGQLSWPIIMFLVLPIVLISPILVSPGSPFVVALSLFPLTGSVVMFMRILVGGVPAWQVVLSIALQLAAIVGAVALAAKIFRVGLLMTGKRFRLGEILRWLRAA